MSATSRGPVWRRRLAAALLLAVPALLAIHLIGSRTPRESGAAPPPRAANAVAATTVLATTHYRIESSAGPAETAQTGAAVEALHVAWSAFFADTLPAKPAVPLQLRLYRDRSEFKANNRSRPWAEGYYLRPVCHAYIATGRPNPTHWMLHEAVHQLNREVGGFATAQWQNEGLATYFGASRLALSPNGDSATLMTGSADADAYPLWWVRDLDLSGDLAQDLDTGTLLPLRVLLGGDGGPPIGEAFNAYYIGWWSLTHFLVHHDGGRHAAGLRRLLAGDGSLAAFEAEFGDIEAMQTDWYAHLQTQVGLLRGSATTGD